MQLPVVISEIAFAVFLVGIMSITAFLYVRYKLTNCQSLGPKVNKLKGSSSNQKDQKCNIWLDLEDFKVRRAQMFP